MVTISDRKQSHALYTALQMQCPHYFVSKNGVKYITDPKAIADYENATGERIGVLYQMGDHEVFVVDLIEKGGQMKLHGRIILPENGVIIIPRVGDKFILEDQYRYPTCRKHLAFPRGHCEPGATPEENAIRETREELGAELTHLECIGKTYPETHSDAWYCSIITGDAEGLTFDEHGAVKRDGYEGIDNLLAYTAEEIDDLIRHHEIDCGYTLAAWAIYRAHAH